MALARSSDRTSSSGAIFSGIAALIIAMVLLRKFLHLEEYLHPIHFENLGKLLLAMSLLWGYFVFTEHLADVVRQRGSRDGGLLVDERAASRRSSGRWSSATS